MPFPQAVPNIPVLDRENCTLFKGRRKGLARTPAASARRPASRAPSTTTSEDTFVDRGGRRHRGGHRLPALRHRPRAARGPQGLRRVRLRRGARRASTACSSSAWPRPPGPTGGEILRPSDGKEPKTVVFVQCVGSRDPREGHAVLLQDLLHVHRQARHALQAQGARRPRRGLLHGHPRRRQGLRRVRRGAPSRRTAPSTSAAASAASTATATRSRSGATTRSAGEQVVIDADMVVLATAVRPQPGVERARPEALA